MSEHFEALLPRHRLLRVVVALMLLFVIAGPGWISALAPLLVDSGDRIRTEDAIDPPTANPNDFPDRRSPIAGSRWVVFVVVWTVVTPLGLGYLLFAAKRLAKYEPELFKNLRVAGVFSILSLTLLLLVPAAMSSRWFDLQPPEDAPQVAEIAIVATFDWLWWAAVYSVFVPGIFRDRQKAATGGRSVVD